jgi:hypothetical protein
MDLSPGGLKLPARDGGGFTIRSIIALLFPLSSYQEYWPVSRSITGFSHRR